MDSEQFGHDIKSVNVLKSFSVWQIPLLLCFAEQAEKDGWLQIQLQPCKYTNKIIKQLPCKSHVDRKSNVRSVHW